VYFYDVFKLIDRLDTKMKPTKA